MDVFQFQGEIVDEYERFTRSFSKIAAKVITDFVNQKYDDGLLGPECADKCNCCWDVNDFRRLQKGV